MRRRAPRGAVAAAPPAPYVFDDAFLRRLERLTLRVQRVVGTVGGRPGLRRTPAADFVDHRPYSPGDDLRHIDWHAAARQDEVFVKIGRAPQAASVHVVLDISRSMAEWPAKRRLTVELAAALGWMSLASGDRVTLAAAPSMGLAQPVWGPATGSARGPGLLAWLAGLEVAGTASTDLGPVVAGLTRAAPAGGLLVLLSDLWVADDLDATLRLAPPPRWETLVLQILDASELDPPWDGPVELVDAESGSTTILAVNEQVRAEYQRALAQRCEQLRALLAMRGAAYALLHADWPLEQAVLPYLQRRAVMS